MTGMTEISKKRNSQEIAEPESNGEKKARGDPISVQDQEKSGELHLTCFR